MKHEMTFSDCSVATPGAAVRDSDVVAGGGVSCSLSHTRTLSPSLPLSLSPSLPLPLSLPLSPSHSLSRTHSLCTHFLTLPGDVVRDSDVVAGGGVPRSFSLAHTLTYTDTYTYTYTYTHTHTHT